MASTQNPLKYTGLSYSEILKQVTDSLKAKKDFDNFRESAIAQTIIEIFTGTADLVNYYIERQAEESFFETSQRPSSAILNSRNLAYDITRPIPASTTIKITIKGNMQGKIVASRKLQFPVFTKFTFQNNDYILQKGFTYTFTTEDAQQVIDQGDDYSKDITVDDNGDDIVLIQGTLKSKTILGATNPMVGQIFQSYRIPDTSFSNYYGNADLADFPTTRVWVGSTEYIIDRRSLINDSTIAGVISGTQVNCCVIRTAVDSDVELKFGTARIASLGASINTGGPNTTFDDIKIQYLSTQGSKANLVGILDEKLTYSELVKLSTFNITDSTTFKFLTNIVGGGDIETSESIKTNAPAIFYSLDRAVNDPDHVNILKSLTTPIRVKNAIAWGEQEEARARGLQAMVELFNIGFFTCVGSLYNIEGDTDTATYTVKTNDNRINEAVLDDNFDENAMSSQYYFNIFVKNMVARQLKEQVIHTWFWKIDTYTPVDTGLNEVYFKQAYPNDVPINFYYKSEKYLTALGESTVITLNLGSITSMTDIATAIQTALRAALDMRSSIVNSLEQNANYGLPIFPEITVTWNPETRTFIIQNAIEDACYLNYISSTEETLVQELGLHAQTGIVDVAYAQKINVNINYNFVSDKITQVIDYITKKAQITLKYIYASPILQSFKLEGNIYVNQLYSVDDLRRQTNNAIYSFLDENADFSKEVYLSSIIDIIKNSPGINHADVRFSPDIPYPTTVPATAYQTTFFFPVIGNYTPLKPYNSIESAVYSMVYQVLQTYCDPSITDEPTWRAFINRTRTLTPDQIYADESLKLITERVFLSDMINMLYSLLVEQLGASGDQVTMFQDTPDFITLVSDIHKDLSWTIRSNMIDSNGNISPEYQVITNAFGVNTKRFLRGGYSLGCEIAKINLESTTPGTLQSPYLNYEYK